MTNLKQALLRLMCVSGALTPFRLANRRKVLILTYHRFSDRDDGVSTPARVFREQLEYLTAHYKIMPLGDIVKFRINGRPFPAGAAAITIDDSYRDAYEIAFPILARYNAPATIFAVTDFIDRKAWLWTDKPRFLIDRAPACVLKMVIGDRDLRLEWDDVESRRRAAAQVNAALKTLPDEIKEETIGQIASSLGVELPELPPETFGPATWGELRKMQSAGIEIGSHTVTHPILTNISDDRLHREVQGSKLRLESVLGHPVDHFCYPDGAHDARVVEAVKRAGYRCGITTNDGLNEQWNDLMALRRVHTELSFPHFVQGTSGAEQIKIELKALIRSIVSTL